MPRPSYATFKWRLILSSFFIIALLAMLVFWKIYAGMQSDRQAAFSQTNSFAQAMSAHVSSRLRVADLSLLRAAEALGELDTSLLENEQQTQRVLGLSASVSNADFWIQFLDVGGKAIASSNGTPSADVSYADRTYFSIHRGQGTGRLYVGVPEYERSHAQRVFFLSRGVHAPNGALRGVVVAVVDAAALADVFAKALYQPTLSITLLHEDGLVIARAPLFEQSFLFNLTNSDLYRLWKNAPRGSYEGRSMVDGQIRVFSYQTVSNAPLTVAVGIAVDSWRRAITADIAVALIALVLTALALTFSGRFALRSLERLVRSDTNQRLLNEKLRSARDENARAEKRMRTIADSLPALVAYVDADERYIFHNSFYRTILGDGVDRMQGRKISDALGEDIYAVIQDEVQAVLAGQETVFECSIPVGKETRCYKFQYKPDIDADRKVVGFYTMAIDVTEAKEVQERLSTLARFDALTSLPNRTQLYEKLGAGLAKIEEDVTTIACLFLDVDHFKSINDSLGHGCGDAALKEFAKRLRSSVRDTDFVARLAGDEFVIILEGPDSSTSASIVAVNVIMAMRVPFYLHGHEIAITTSIGAAIARSGDDVDTLLQRADQALYHAKHAGRDVFKLCE